MTDAWTEPAEPAEDFDDAPVAGDPAAHVIEHADEQVIEDADEIADEAPDQAPDEVPDEIDAGIPDEPEVFVEEIEAAAVLDGHLDEHNQVAADLPETGDPRVDDVVAKLAGIAGRPTTEHVGVYDEVHRGLQDALANLDQG